MKLLHLPIKGTVSQFTVLKLFARNYSFKKLILNVSRNVFLNITVDNYLLLLSPEDNKVTTERYQ